MEESDVATPPESDGKSEADSPARPPQAPAAAPGQARLTFEELFEVGKLRTTWKQLRRELSKSARRDCVDYAESDLHLSDWIAVISRDVVRGVYQPHPPIRREESKKMGAFRVITIPTVRDALIYRHLCDYAYQLARPSEWRGAFFSRRHRQELVGAKVDSIDDEEDYMTFFEIWKRYAAYRKVIGLGGMYRLLVVTDLSNYFETIQHELLFEHLGSLGIPRKALGVLGKLLRVLRPESGHSPSPAVGLPTDEVECSRTLAHIFLFEYDREIAAFVGSDAYVRWMDDQNVGVGSAQQARSVVRQMVTLLSQQRLTLNAGKTKFLTPEQVSAEYWLELNEDINRLEFAVSVSAGKPGFQQGVTASKVHAAWSSLIDGVGRGQWDKIAKRLLALDALAGLDVATLDQCKFLLVQCPGLAGRLFGYLAARKRHLDSWALFMWLLDTQESFYEDVEASWFESILENPPDAGHGELVSFARSYVSEVFVYSGRPGARVPAVLLVYWLGDESDLDWVVDRLKDDAGADALTRRAELAVLCARRPDRLYEWLSLASSVPQVGVSSLTSWLLGLRSGILPKLPNPLVFAKFSKLTRREHYDARAFLRLELLLQSPRREVLKAVQGAAKRALKARLGAAERATAERIGERAAQLLAAQQSTTLPRVLGA